MKLKRTNPASELGTVIGVDRLHYAIYAHTGGLTDEAMKSKKVKLTDIRSIVLG